MQASNKIDSFERNNVITWKRFQVCDRILICQVVFYCSSLWFLGLVSLHLSYPTLSFAQIRFRIKRVSSIFSSKVKTYRWFVFINSIKVFQVIKCFCCLVRATKDFEMTWILIISSIDVSNIFKKCFYFLVRVFKDFEVTWILIISSIDVSNFFFFLRPLHV
jgi:hypothetical protein